MRRSEAPEGRHGSTSRSSELVDQAGEAPPAFGLLVERLQPGFRDRRSPRLAVAFGALPGALDPALLAPAARGRIERALVQIEGVVGDLGEPAGEPVCVLRAHRGERPQHDQIEGSLQQLDASASFTGHPSGPRREHSARFTWVSMQVEDRRRDRPASTATVVTLALTSAHANPARQAPWDSSDQR